VNKTAFVEAGYQEEINWEMCHVRT